jgi:two-component system cell cycle response regulator DivK
MCAVARSGAGLKRILGGQRGQVMAKVLVIEDNFVNMKLAVLLLNKAGHTVLCAADAETGLMLARSDAPDLILMDFQLPGMDGLAATAVLKQDPLTAAIPVIALTAMAMSEEQPRIACCDAHIAKPLRYQELYAAIDAILGRRRSGAAATPEQAPSRVVAAIPATPAVAVDLGVLESLVGRDPSLILEFVGAFRLGAAQIVPELIAACEARQVLQASRLAHKLRSSAHSVGALTLGGLCAELEAAGRAGQAEKLALLAPVFEKEWDAVNACLDALAAPLADPGV